MASEPPPPEPDAVIPPAPVLLPPSPPPPVESEVPIDDDRATLAGILPGSEGKVLKGEAKEVLFGNDKGSALGRFVASRMLDKPSFRESTLLYHRAKVGLVELASMSVAILANEIGKDEPSKVKIDACLALQRGTGIMVDSVPVNDADRQISIAEDNVRANLSPQQLLERVTGRLQAMRSASATGEGKAS